MYERFTDRARKVMQLANVTAKKMNHEYLGTEHILIGLLEEGTGVAANVLRNIDLNLNKCKEEVLKVVQAGPDCISLGDKLPLTPRSKKVIEYSVTEARRLDHNYVGTEHLLLGMLRVTEGIACQVLENLGVKMDDVIEEVENLLGVPPKGNKADEKVAKIKGIIAWGKSSEETLKEIKQVINER